MVCMIIRRYYNRQVNYPYYFHPEIKTFHELVQFAEENSEVPVYDYDNAEYEMVLSHEEQNNRWIETVAMVMRNTRWVLDNLDDLHTYKVRWNMNQTYNRKLTVGSPPLNITKYCDKVYNVL